MEDSVLMELLTGPFSALVLAISLLMGLYKLAGKYLPKIIQRHVQMIDELQDSQQQIVNKLVELSTQMTQQHANQTEAMRKAIAGVHIRLNHQQDDLKEVKFKLGLPVRAEEADEA